MKNKLIILMLLFSFAGFGQEAHWRFENNANDELGNHNGSLMGSAWYESEAGYYKEGSYSLGCDGEDAGFDCGSWDLTGSFTICMWWRRGTQAGQPTLFTNQYYTTSYGFRLYWEQSSDYFCLHTKSVGGDLIAYSSTGGHQADVWEHIAVVVNRTAGTAKIYFNGSDVTVQNYAKTDFTTNANNYIGRTGDGNYDSYAYFDDVQIYLCELSADSISYIYNNLADLVTCEGGVPPESQVYYFSSENGNDGNEGTSPEEAWQSMSKLQTLFSSLDAGDTVFFERGSKWFDVELTINNVDGSSGNEIVFMPYGTGTKPIFSGGMQVTSFTQNGSIWSKVDAAFPPDTHVPHVFINNELQDISYWSGYGGLGQCNTMDATTVVDTDSSWTTNKWTGAWVAARYDAFDYICSKITSNTSNTLTFANNGRGEKTDRMYFIYNTPFALLSNGDYYFNTDTLKIYYSGALNSRDVEISNSDTLIYMTGSSYLKFDELEFHGARYVLFKGDGNSYIKFHDCRLNGASACLVHTNNSSYYEFLNSELWNAEQYGIFYNGSTGLNFQNNSVKRIMWNIGNEVGFGDFSGGITNVSSGRIRVLNNRFDSCAIGFHTHQRNDTVRIENNLFIDYAGLYTDVGAIYAGACWDESKVGIIKKNLFWKAWHEGEFMGWTGNSKHAIYFDYSTSGYQADTNTIVDAETGIYLHVCDDNYVRGNLIYLGAENEEPDWNDYMRMDEWTFNHGGEGTSNVDNYFYYNTLILSDNTNDAFIKIHDLQNPTSNDFDYNKYLSPFTTQNAFDIWSDYTGSSVTFSTWQSTYSWEANSTYNATQYDTCIIFYNWTDSPVDRYFTATNAVDESGGTVSGSVTVQPYMSRAIRANGLTAYDELLYIGEEEEPEGVFYPYFERYGNTFIPYSKKLGRSVIFYLSK